MNNIFRDHLPKFILVLFDNILIYSSKWEDHLHHVEIVFKILKQQNLFLKQAKCQFAQKKVHYLGHIICNGKVKMMLTRSNPL